MSEPVPGDATPPKLCSERQDVAKLDESHTCAKDYRHVFAPSGQLSPTGIDDRAHECSCGTWFYDNQQIAEAEAGR